MCQNRVLIYLAIVIVAVTTYSCGAVHTSIKKRNLDVQTRMSDSIFLEPVGPAKHTVYVQVRNTSDKDLDIKLQIKEALVQGGYKVINDPKKVHYLLQANILQCGKSDLRNANDALQAGFGGAFAGAAGTYALGGSGRQAAGFGLLGALAATVGDALVDDTVYTLITDLQISERARKGEIVSQNQSANIAQGSSTQLNQNISGSNRNWKIYRTRILSTAEKVNLDFTEAKPALEQGLVRALSGVFAE